MDIQKELINCNNWILEQDDDFVTGYGQGNYALGLARLAWQAAKEQAVPEGFVLVPKEPTDEMWSSGIDAYADAMESNKTMPAISIIDIYKAMIEAQDQSNDQLHP